MNRATLSAPMTGRGCGLLDATAVADRDNVGGEHVEQALQVPGLERPLEGFDEPPVPARRGDRAARSAGFDVAAGAVGDLVHGGGSLVDRGRDLVIAESECFAQHEHRPFGRGQCLEHEHQRHRHAFGEFDVGGHIRCGEQWLRQPRAYVSLPAPFHRAQPVE